MQVEKCATSLNSGSDGRVEAKCQQPDSKARVAYAKPDAANVANNAERERHLEHWLGTTYQAIACLSNTYENLIPSLIHDLEVQEGLRILQNITWNTLDLLKPFTEKYHTNNKYGHEISRHLISSVFPDPKNEQHTAKYNSPYGALIALTGLHVYLSNVEAHLTALRPVSQALWDKDFQTAVEAAKSNVQRMQSWVRRQINVRSPQTLVVPSTALIKGDARWSA